MIGRKVVDHHKNTATSKHVNDRLRRRAKRIERLEVDTNIKLGSFFSALFGR